MDNSDTIVTPILKAINDLRDEIRENRREIIKNREDIKENRATIQSVKEELTEFKDEMYEFKDEMYEFRDETREHFEKIEAEANKRWRIYQEQIQIERKYIGNILESFQTSAEAMYYENKGRIDKLEKQLKVVNA